MDKSGRGVPGALRGALVERSAEANKMDMELPPPTRGRLASQALSPPPAAAQKKPNNVLSSAHGPSLEQEQSSERIIHSFLPSARHGDHSGVASALRNPLVDPNMTDEVGNTALLTTCLLKRVAVVKLLLADKRVDPNIANKGGNTALSFVARHGSLSVLKLLLAEDRTIRTRPGHGGENYDAALAWLNRQGTDADAAPEEFLPAARDGDDSTVASALRNPLVNPNMTIVDDHDDDDDGDGSGSNIRSNTTALMLSASAGHISVMKLLLADGRVDINRTDPGGDSALSKK
jgi:ankyrin repeat protein